jgi:putative methyltransferase
VAKVTRPELTDWVDWHDPYADPESPLSQRLKVIQRHVRTFLDECEAAAPRVVSLCAGDGRDLLDVLAEHPRGPQVRARLVELDPTLAARARHRAAVGGLDSIDVICSDAASIDSYAAAIPAELVLVCGVFGNISDGDVRRTIDALPQLCASDATVIWTRHRYHPDRTPTLKRWFAAAGFAERAFDSPGANQWSVGMHTFRGEPQPLAPGERLFSFVR